MPVTVEIDGVGRVEFDDSFRSLSPEQQQAAVDEVMRSQGGEQRGPTAAAPVSAATTGLGRVANAVGDAALGIGYQFTGGFNQALGNLAAGMAEVDPIQRGLDWAGIDARTPITMARDALRTPVMQGPEPGNAAERIVRRGGEVLGETVAPAGAMFGMARAGVAALPKAGAVRQGASQILEMIRKAPYASAAIERTGAIGAGIGGGTAREVAPGNKLAEVTGELAGGLGLPLATQYGSPALAVRGGKALYRAGVDRFTEEGAARRAIEKLAPELREHMSSDQAQRGIQRAQELRQEIPGFEPSLAQQTELPALVATQQAVERQAAGADLDTAVGRHQQARDAVEAYRQRVAPQGASDPERAVQPLVAEREAAGSRLRQLEAQREQNERLRKQAADWATEQRQSQQSAATASSIQRAEDAMNVNTALSALSDQERMALSSLDGKLIQERLDLAQNLRGPTVLDRRLLGSRLRAEVSAARDRRSAEMSELARDLGINDADMGIPFANFRAAVTKWRSGMELPSQTGNMPSSLRDVEALAEKASAGRPVTFKEIKALREGVNDELLELVRDTSPGFRKRRANAVALKSLIDKHLLSPNEVAESIQAAQHYASNPSFVQIYRDATQGVGKQSYDQGRLSSFVVSNGGIRDGAGSVWAELRGTDVRRPGLLNKNGLTLEQMAEAAMDAGFFSDVPREMVRSDDFIRRFQQALEDDVMGRRLHYSAKDQKRADAANAARETADEFARIMDMARPGWEQVDPATLQRELATMQPGMDPVFAANYQQFRQRYFDEFIKPFEQGTVLDVRRKDGTGFYRTLDEEIASEFLATQEGARQFQAILGSNPQAVGDLTAVALDSLADASIREGMINLRGLESWLTKHRGALQELPSVRAAIDRIAADTRSAFEQHRLATDQLRQAIGQQRQQLVTAQRQLTEGGLRDRRQSYDALAEIGDQFREQNDQFLAAQTKLDEAMAPLRERLGLLTERKMAREDRVLAQKLGQIEAGQREPADLVAEAMTSPKLMLNLRSRLGQNQDALSALRRTVWDNLGQYDGSKLGEFLNAHEKSLRLLFSERHMGNLRDIADAMRMLESVPPPTSGRPIAADAVEEIRRVTGFNPMQASSRWVNISSGRLSKRVAGFDFLMRTLNARRSMASERLLREVLYNPQVAEAVMAYAKAGGAARPSRALTAWLATQGILNMTGDD